MNVLGFFWDEMGYPSLFVVIDVVEKVFDGFLVGSAPLVVGDGPSVGKHDDGLGEDFDTLLGGFPRAWKRFVGEG